VLALGVTSASKLLREDEGGEGDPAVRSCLKYGIVDMSGERAHGFVEDVRSCSKVGSTTLKKKYVNHHTVNLTTNILHKRKGC
jgi:hypothetical protein